EARVAGRQTVAAPCAGEPAMSRATDRWRRGEGLCQAAMEVPEAERSEVLLESCDDPDVRREVLSLLARAGAGRGFLEFRIAAAASGLPAAFTSLSGRRVGAFEVGPLLGAGGMGEVYKAHDTRLNRDVALKILPQTFALDPDRLTRFRREAHVLASLNHPNIGAIYRLPEAGGVHAPVLHLVDVPTPDDRLAQGRLPLADPLPIATQIPDPP